MDREEGLAILCAAVADSLGLDLEDVRPESRLVTDLGADSLDFIDLIFAMEKQFGVKLRQGEFDFLSRLDMTSPEAVRDGYLTRASVDRLLPWLPALEAEDPDRVTPKQLFGLITVETFWRIVQKHKA